jgi:hypothetical protein
MSESKPNRNGRKALDDIVGRMVEPGFAASHPRESSKKRTGAHVNPEILALSQPRSRYVRQWRRHARHCQDCSNVFRYLGISLG